MNIVLFGSSLVSAYWNGAATYYRGMCKALHQRGHRVVFVEPDIYERQQHRDLAADPAYAEVRVCRGWDDLADELERARGADLVAKCSGVGAWDEELARGVLDLRGPDTRVAFWDVDAPQTLANPGCLRALIRKFDLVLLYGGGPPVQRKYAQLGARAAHLVYNAVDPDEYFPVPPESEKRCDLLFMGNRMPDREQRVWDLFLRAAQLAPEQRFVLGGNGWGDCRLPPNVRWVGHVPTGDHRAWNCSARLVLNVNRADMAATGYSPPTRVFEAAGCGACVVTDTWEGINTFFSPGTEILVAHTTEDLVSYLRTTSASRAAAIGAVARARVLRDHTYARRAAALDQVLHKLTREPNVLASRRPPTTSGTLTVVSGRVGPARTAGGGAAASGDAKATPSGAGESAASGGVLGAHKAGGGSAASGSAGGPPQGPGGSAPRKAPPPPPEGRGPGGGG
jgi:spore maturation protein CgeB